MTIVLFPFTVPSVPVLFALLFGPRHIPFQYGLTSQGVERYTKGEPFGAKIVTCFLIRRPTVQTKERIACLVYCDRVKGSLKLHDLQRR